MEAASSTTLDVNLFDIYATEYALVESTCENIADRLCVKRFSSFLKELLDNIASSPIEFYTDTIYKKNVSLFYEVLDLYRKCQANHTDDSRSLLCTGFYSKTFQSVQAYLKEFNLCMNEKNSVCLAKFFSKVVTDCFRWSIA